MISVEYTLVDPVLDIPFGLIKGTGRKLEMTGTARGGQREHALIIEILIIIGIIQEAEIKEIRDFEGIGVIPAVFMITQFIIIKHKFGGQRECYDPAPRIIT